MKTFTFLMATGVVLAGMSLSVQAIGVNGLASFQNDSSSLITLAGPSNVLPADLSVANQAVNTSGALTGGISLDVGLYAGYSPGSLSLAIVYIGTNPILLDPASGGSGVPGEWNPQNLEFAGFQAGETVFMQIKVWDSAYSSYEAEVSAHPLGDDYSGINNVFQMTPDGITYPSIITGGGSTWTAVGNENPIIVGVASVPEPSTIGLVVVGLLGVLTIRRRKA